MQHYIFLMGVVVFRLPHGHLQELSVILFQAYAYYDKYFFGNSPQCSSNNLCFDKKAFFTSILNTCMNFSTAYSLD